MITVSNSSPLIFLAKLGCFNFLKMLFQKISIPNEVYVDIAVKDKGRPGDKELNSAIKDSWLEVIEIKKNDAIEKSMREWKIHRGEAEAIFLAQKLADARLLTDDDMAVIRARSLKISVIRTPIILLLAKKEQLISTIKERLDDLIAQGYWMSRHQYKALLEIANEF